MNKKIIFTAVALAFLAVSCNKPAVQIQKPVAINPTPAPVEDFISQSAKEIINPLIKQKPTEPKKPIGICLNQDSQSFDCYEKFYQEVVKSQGVTEAFADLKTRYATNSYVVAQCHPLTHVIGNAAVAKYPTVAEAYTHGDSVCWSGYYHGVLEGVVGQIGRNNLADQLDSICDGVAGKANYSFDYYNCVHGLGHGVMAFTNDELFDSLNLCDRINGNWEQLSCYSGVFMENVIIDNKNHFTKYLKPSEPLYPCNAVDDKYKGTCYLMQTSYMLKVANENFQKVFELCSTVEDAYRATCYQSLGRDASGHSSSNLAATKATCELGNNFEQQSNCIVGAVKDFISYFHSDVQAKELCNALAADLQTLCLDTAESYYKSF